MTKVYVVVDEDVRLCYVCWDAAAGDVVIPVIDCVMDLSVL